MKQIIITSTSSQSGGFLVISVVFWFPVTAGDELPQSGRDSSYAGASAAELAALRTGTVIEETKGFTVPASLPGASIKSLLESAYADRKAYLDGLASPGEYYGTSWDGTSWSA